eukprot:CAMPEP_0201522014 /NCGR_PEP_ID=MMETSP0161_2-20130828/16407_1 /ASSEMBLY_ACC=CAM_ASM_000251 /TAXON_ID=180227 /ORGANISM="Neoparamoeba aestuarina, Strain SoJaBio B1-5/56/2" /LENGTH=418 /DNA_ID=CAMNT_0047920763 /DNA_START=8 /DNA_END=1264 /DNA_ORIENTATION=-
MADVGFENAQMKELMAALQKEKGVLKRTFNRNHTIVEQDSQNSCFFKLESGSIRFEKRAIKNGIVEKTTALGTMDSNADWTFFCELSAFGIQNKTSAAIVAESESTVVWVVPVDSFLTFAEGNPQFHVLFYKNITKRLAQMLRGLHSRTLNISSLQKSTCGQMINNEAAIFSWPGTVKSGFGKAEGQLILSKSYVAFVKKKVGDKEGVVHDAGEEKYVVSLKSLQELSFMGQKVTVKDEKTKITCTVKDEISGDAVRDVISMAKNSCEKGTKVPEKGSDKRKGIAEKDLVSLKEKFDVVKYNAGQIVQKTGTKVDRIGYVLEGTVAVKVTKPDGKELILNDVQPGETIGDIGAFTNNPSSADLMGGKNGCSLLEIPLSFLFANSNFQFRVRIFFSLICLMWDRIISQEERQVKNWLEQ